MHVKYIMLKLLKII